MLDQRWRAAGIQMTQCLTFECVCTCVLLSLLLSCTDVYYYYVLDQGLSDSK